ncbi:MAG: hypothetical protein ACRDRO_22325 [Pseudonocardiaceae bacterium]
MTLPAPIAVFGHARPRLLATTLAALAHCHGFRGVRVHVFCDAPASEAEAPRAEASQRVAAAWCRRHGARLVRRSANQGLHNLTNGIDELCASEGAAISLEDDHIPAATALHFLDRALAHYQHDEAVFQVCAYRPGGRLAGTSDTFFLPLPMPVGWGTWNRAWERFSWECPEAGAVLTSPERRHAFDLGGAYPAALLLAQALAGEFNSYFIRWYCAVFSADALALCPRDSLVRNAGLGSGLHGHGPSERRAHFHNGAWNPQAPVENWRFPPVTAVDPTALALLRDALRCFGRPATVAP